MARARNIKPAFFDNDELADIDPLGRLLFIGLWTLADFKGDLEWRSKRIKKQLLAYDDCNISELAINLDKSGFIRFYSDGNKTYLNVSNFTKHQNPHKNERDKGSEIPAITNEMRQAVDLNTLTINRDLSGLERSSSTSNPADSLNLIPDSPIPYPETLKPESGLSKPAAKADIDFSSFGMTDDQISEVKRIRRKNKGGAITQRVANALAKEFHQAATLGYSFDELITEWELRGWKSFKSEWIKPKAGMAQTHSAVTDQNIKNIGEWLNE